MPAKSVVSRSAAACLGFAALALLAGPLHAKAPLPTVMLYPATPADVTATVDLRTRLRLDGQVQVLTYDPESAAVRRAAAEESHPEWLTGTLTDDGARYSLARALGAAFYIVVSPGRQPDSTHLELVDTTPAALAFDWYGTNRQYGARALESQIQAALARPPIESIAAAPVAAAPVAAAPVATQPAVIAAVPPVPVVATPPVPVAAVPAPESGVAVPAPETQAAPALPAPLPLLAGTGKPVAAIPTGLPGTIITPERVVARPMPAPVSGLLPTVTVLPRAVGPVAIAAVPPVKIKLPEQVVTRAAAPEQKIARVFPPAIPTPEVAPAIELPETPPTATPEAPAVIAAPPMKVPSAKAVDLTPVQMILVQGDAAMDAGDFAGAISLYRQAVNGVPLSVVPRLKLAQAYQKSGMNDKALDEAKRAVEISPEDESLQKFLAQRDQESGTSDGSLARARALVERDSTDVGAHNDLAEALWDSGDLRGAETEYLTAKKLSAAGDHAADAHLAQLYAAQGRYDDSLEALKAAGGAGYLLALKIVRNRAETLSSTIESSRSAFAGAKITREQFYDTAKKTSADSQALADFVSRLKPLPAYKLSHLHRMLAANLLAQEAATLVSAIETGSDQMTATVSQLDKSAMTEMLTARAAEEKLGLWPRPVQDGKRE